MLLLGLMTDQDDRDEAETLDSEPVSRQTNTDSKPRTTTRQRGEIERWITKKSLFLFSVLLYCWPYKSSSQNYKERSFSSIDINIRPHDRPQGSDLSLITLLGVINLNIYKTKHGRPHSPLSSRLSGIICTAQLPNDQGLAGPAGPELHGVGLVLGDKQ